MEGSWRKSPCQQNPAHNYLAFGSLSTASPSLRSSPRLILSGVFGPLPALGKHQDHHGAHHQRDDENEEVGHHLRVTTLVG